jgi:hypothetical protein
MPTRMQIADSKRRKLEKVALCSKCQIEKPWSEFEVSPNRRPFGLSSHCNPCDLTRKASLARTIRRKKTKEQLQADDRMRNLRSVFGITVEEYEAMHEAQGGVCAICKQPENYKHYSTSNPGRLAVDHCHETKAIRGLLCGRCNKGIGLLQEDINVLIAAATYLHNSKGVADAI